VENAETEHADQSADIYHQTYAVLSELYPVSYIDRTNQFDKLNQSNRSRSLLMRVTDEYHNTLPAVIDSIGSDNFSVALLEFIRSIASFDSAVVMAYPEASALQVIHNALHPGDQSGFGSRYQDHLWLLSPLYLSAKSGVRGFFHILDIAPENFKHSEYYNLYYHSNGVKDQVGFLVESGDATPIAISLERTPALRSFSKTDKKRLNDVAATLSALVKQHWPAGMSNAPGATTETLETNLHQHVEKLLSQFGSSYLTPRERDVVQLVLKGYPSKVAAQRLGISSQTEQVHRKNIYQKLGLSSHGELFSLFFDALVQPCPAEGDPLTQLMRK
jgi:DNA-binding CsgD family transcriptional regulator